MKTLLSAVLGLALMGACHATLAADEPAKGCEMPSMDLNGDGFVSHDEFTKHHETMWSNMKKNTAGQVDMKTMRGQMKCGMRDGMMGPGSAKDDMAGGMKHDMKGGMTDTPKPKP